MAGESSLMILAAVGVAITFSALVQSVLGRSLAKASKPVRDKANKWLRKSKDRLAKLTKKEQKESLEKIKEVIEKAKKSGDNIENELDTVLKDFEASKALSGTGKFSIGPYNEFKGQVPGLDAHHVGQQAAMKRFVPGYDPTTAPSILVPKVGHTIRGPNAGRLHLKSR